MKTRKIQLELHEHTFAALEALAFGLHIQDGNEITEEWKGYNKSKDDFSPAVRELLVQIANSVSTGVVRPGSWERGVVDSLTGWDGTFNRGMLAECIKDDFK
ncbi:hypothetical protein LCX91_004942 [Vibrio parahaemolyticus]|nr:hypothetical protein [Vibrio parahaemolyticus]EIE1223082.1 hypothetical protein [Vibrio parahaemolyticus]EIE1261119.1 hypothetical protein [Vibrio parahaemolyticus]EIE1338913.1 hypothetical protein [Vibrio parahaemolyticus]EJC6883904.1 hypothetical protein [Vibrio parahaemolyticus]